MNDVPDIQGTGGPLVPEPPPPAELAQESGSDAGTVLAVLLTVGALSSTAVYYVIPYCG